MTLLSTVSGALKSLGRGIALLYLVFAPGSGYTPLKKQASGLAHISKAYAEREARRILGTTAMLTRFSLLLTLGLAGACSAVPPKTAHLPAATPADSVEAEEYAVLSAVVRAKFVTPQVKRIVIADHTSAETTVVSGAAREGMREVPEDLVADFEAKNASSRPLRPLFNLPVSYALVGEAKLDSILYRPIDDELWNLIYGPRIFLRRPMLRQQGTDPWDRFYEVYPHSQGMMYLSAPGFNAGMDTALVCVGNRSGWNTSVGYLVFLTKSNGVWVIKKEVLLWVS